MNLGYRQLEGNNGKQMIFCQNKLVDKNILKYCEILGQLLFICYSFVNEQIGGIYWIYFILSSIKQYFLLGKYANTMERNKDINHFDYYTIAILLSFLIIYNNLRMVKGYDPTSSDVSALAWDYLFSFARKTAKVTIQQSQRLVKHWLANSSSTSLLYRSFSNLPIKPRIVLSTKCNPNHSNLIDLILPQNIKQFPAFIKEDSIVLCVDKMDNKLQLKENLDRELKLMNLRARREKEVNEDERQLMQDIFESCKEGYRNYYLGEKTTKEMAITCTKYLFFRQSQSDLPLDRRFRYVSQLAEEIFT